MRTTIRCPICLAVREIDPQTKPTAVVFCTDATHVAEYKQRLLRASLHYGQSPLHAGLYADSGILPEVVAQQLVIDGVPFHTQK